MSKIDQELTDALEQMFTNGLTGKAIESVKKDLRELADSIEDDIEWRIKDEMAMRLTGWVAQMAERAVEAMLSGNDSELRRYLSCEKRGEDGQYIGWTGRSDGYNGPNKRIEDQHPVIHEKLFEQGAVLLRKQVASANEALLRDERIRDLEDQVKSLVAQVNKANAEKEEMWQRTRNVA